MEKLIISVATTGAITTRDNSPYVPITPQEIADEVYASWQAGAAIGHIHVRDAQGGPSMDVEAFRETVRLIRTRGCDIILNLTSSGGLHLKDDERLRPIALCAEMGSFDAGSMNFGADVFINHPAFLETLAAEFRRYGVKPELEIFDAGMINNAMALVQKGLIPKPLHFQFVLGVAGGMPATPRNLLFLVESIPSDATWSVIGVGPGQMPMVTMALAMGGHVRVGMEDNVYLEKKVLAKSNAQFVERIVKLAQTYGRGVATPDEARRILALNGPRERVEAIV